VLEILPAFHPLFGQTNPAFVLPALHHYGRTPFSLQGFIVNGGIDTQHHPGLTHTDAHLLINQERYATEHFLLFDVGQMGKRTPDPAGQFLAVVLPDSGSNGFDKTHLLANNLKYLRARRDDLIAFVVLEEQQMDSPLLRQLPDAS
jgi:hypothetical protein